MDVKQHKLGILYGLAAYGLWGLLPIYWKQINHVWAFEILANRFVWSAVFVALLIICTGKLQLFRQEVKATFSNWHSGLMMVAASVMVCFNWGIYIWAVEDGRILETALGYYINPMLSVCLGVFVLKESMNRLEQIAVVLAICGISCMIVKTGYLPWVAITEAMSFCAYGFTKKFIPVSVFTSIFLETLIMLPLMLGYLIYLGLQGVNAFQLYDGVTAIYLAGCGVITATPLMLFTACAQRVPLYLLGFMQYISPTISMTIGVFLYNEVFTSAHAWTFGLIWTGLVFFTYAQIIKIRH